MAPAPLGNGRQGRHVFSCLASNTRMNSTIVLHGKIWEEIAIRLAASTAFRPGPIFYEAPCISFSTPVLLGASLFRMVFE